MTTPIDARVPKLIIASLLLALAGCIGIVASSFLLMGSDSCMADPAPRRCTATVQWWIAWLPLIGAVAGVVMAGCIGAICIRRGKAVSGAITLGWTAFVIAELAVLSLMWS